MLIKLEQEMFLIEWRFADFYRKMFTTLELEEYESK